MIDQIDHSKKPKHIAIIMDGNGRWATLKGLSRVEGHKNGVESVRAVIEASAELDLEYLTLYAFSTENWSRPKQEVDALMNLLVETIKNEVSTLNKNNISLQAIGNLKSLPESCQKNLAEAIEDTAKNTGLTVNLALSYSARWELSNAMKEIAEKVENGTLIANEINEQVIEAHLCTAHMPDPELLIRTSGECRVSNFLLWQIAYSEFYFTETLWPDFRKNNFYKAIIDYQNRERRFGKTSEQIS